MRRARRRTRTSRTEPAIANNGDLQGGHLNHTGPVFPADDWGDIIPPYTYTDQSGNEAVFPGRNWDAAGQAIWQNGCDPGLDPLQPAVECVEVGASGGFLAHFGYVNPNEQARRRPAGERLPAAVGERAAADVVPARAAFGRVPGRVERGRPCAGS